MADQITTLVVPAGTHHHITVRVGPAGAGAKLGTLVAKQGDLELAGAALDSLVDQIIGGAFDAFVGDSLIEASAALDEWIADAKSKAREAARALALELLGVELAEARDKPAGANLQSIPVIK